MRRLRSITLALVGVVGMASALPVANVGASQGTPYIVVALGDSYASGEGLYAGPSPGSAGSWLTRGDHPARHDDGCHRSPYSYPALSARWLATRLHRPVILRFLACSGATTADLWAAPNRSPLLAGAEKLEAAQVTARALREANLVTITIGGNDVGFVNVLGICELASAVCTGSTGAGLAATLSHRIEALQATLSATYAQVRRLAPDATIDVVEYPALFPPTSTSSCQGLAASTIPAFAAAEAQLNQVTGAAARAAGVHVINPDSTGLFANHSVCSNSSLFGGIHSAYLAAAFHPTRAGQAAIARALELSLQG
jgi:lysophospholipase L1-like esterase